MVTADTTRSYNHSRRMQRKITHNHARAFHTPCDGIGFQYLAMYAINCTIAHRKSIDPVTKLECYQSLLHSRAYAPDERLNDARTSSPGNMKARDRVAMSSGEVTTAFRPLYKGEKAYTLSV